MNRNPTALGVALSNVRIDIPQNILDSARLKTADIKLELAVALYGQRRLSIGKARELAGLSLWEFRQILASRKVPPHYDAEDLAEDLDNLRAMGENQ
jgi:predicted HTH domain antitoxin